MKKTPLLLSLTAAALLLVGCATDDKSAAPKTAAAGTKAAPAAAAPKANPNKVEIFNGKDLTGFKKLGGEAAYAVSPEGHLVGTSTLNTPNTFLATDKDYGNFVLEYDFKNDPRLNSGVQFRSHAEAKEVNYKTPEGKAAKVLDQMTDGDVRTILGMMNDRQAAAILTSMSASRAAAITKGGSKAPGGSL